ncbi:MAG TPA: signal peptide peptidase SppA [Streptosporangiaceae bacterium]|nr:signal peptide peptidase SppA [Streptosporangiaceae bacterium]
MVEATFIDELSRLRQRHAAPLILELDLSEGVAEEPPADVVSAVLAMRRPRLADVLDGLRRARADDKVQALVVKIGGRPIGFARVQELRSAIAAFRRSGKATVAWAETYGEFGPGNTAYYLATAFERVWLQPSGDVGLTGLSLEQWFLRGTMDKLGLEYEVSKRHEYKTAADRLTEQGFTGPAREALQQLASSLTGQITEAVAERLAISPEQARMLIDNGPYIAQEAVELRLVDALGYRDEVYDDVRKSAGPDAHLLYLARYQRSRALAERARKLPDRGADMIALIYAAGPIRRGRSGRGPMSSGAMGSDTVSAALRTAAADRRVRAIVLRVNSPGGSYVASDTIWREVVRARQAGTPIVVSMGDVAASGGYYISMAADEIVAQPGTITGSIGVLSGKPVTSSLLERVGITTDSVTVGAHADMFSTTRPFSEEEWAKVNSWLDRIYADFTGKVALGRKMTSEQVHEIARGRVWTGADAAAIGLVDHLGGLDDAIALARRKAGLPDSAPVRGYPRTTPLDRVRRPESSEDYRAAGARMFTENWGPVWRIAAGAGLPPFGPLHLGVPWSFQ